MGVLRREGVAVMGSLRERTVGASPRCRAVKVIPEQGKKGRMPRRIPTQRGAPGVRENRWYRVTTPCGFCHGLFSLPVPQDNETRRMFR